MSDSPKTGSPPAPPPERRRFLRTAASVGMAGGLVAGYGAFGAVAGRYLYPAGDRETAWVYVVDLASVAVGASLTYVTPAGQTVAIARTADTGAAEDFIALSSTCPHLGCQVHWEAQNNRFFCPCHNGVFDPDGRGISGPPGKAGQSLARFPLEIRDQLLFINVPIEPLSDARDPNPCRGCDRPGHDPCLRPRNRRDGIG